MQKKSNIDDQYTVKPFTELMMMEDNLANIAMENQSELTVEQQVQNLIFAYSNKRSREELKLEQFR